MTNTTTQLTLGFIESPIILVTIEASTTFVTILSLSKIIKSTTTKTSSIKKISEATKIALNKSIKSISRRINKHFLS